MSLRDKKVKVGNLVVYVYDFDDSGDILPNHIHDETTAHITIVAKGSIKVTGSEWVQTWAAGTVAEIKANQAHEFEALESNTRVVNIVKSMSRA